MRSLKAASGSSVRVISQLAPTVLGVHSFFKLKIPFGVCMNAMRIGRCRGGGERRRHGIEHGQGKGGAHPAQESAPGNSFLKDYHR